MSKSKIKVFTILYIFGLLFIICLNFAFFYFQNFIQNIKYTGPVTNYLESSNYIQITNAESEVTLKFIDTSDFWISTDNMGIKATKSGDLYQLTLIVSPGNLSSKFYSNIEKQMVVMSSKSQFTFVEPTKKELLIFGDSVIVVLSSVFAIYITVCLVKSYQKYNRGILKNEKEIQV